MLAVVLKQLAELLGSRFAERVSDDVARPEISKLLRDIGFLLPKLANGAGRALEKRPGSGSFVEDSLRMATLPFIGMAEQGDEFCVGILLQVECGGRFRLSVGDLVDAAAAAKGSVVIVAFAQVIPVGHVNGSVGSVGEVHTTKPLIVGQHEAFETVEEDAAAVGVARKELAAIFLGPVPAEVNHAAAVRMSASEGDLLSSRTRLLPFLAGPMQVIRTGLDVLVGVRIEMFAVHSLEARARHDVPQVADDVVGKEELPVLVPIMPPWIGCAVSDGHDGFGNRVKLPNADVDLDSFGVRRAGLTHL